MLIIPNNRLNGYNIIAQARVLGPPEQGTQPVYALLGHDPSRRYPAYVTALATQSSVTDHREWFWGHYFENGTEALTLALGDWLKRLKLSNEGKQNIVEDLMPQILSSTTKGA